MSVILLLLIHIVFVVGANDQANDKKIFCLHLSKSIDRQFGGAFLVDYIDENLCTHLIYGYMGIDEQGNIVSLDSILDFKKGNIKKFNNKKHYNTKLRTIVAVGGWDVSEESQKYSNVLRSEENQKRFVDSALDLIEKYNFDGLALHWAYPGVRGGDPAEDKFTMDILLGKLKSEFSRRNLLLTAICHGMTDEIDESYNVKNIGRLVDYVILYSYDFYTVEANSHIGLASGLYLHPNETDTRLSVDQVVKNWLERECPPEKLIMGIPFFGRMFTLKYDNQTEPGSYFVGARKSRYTSYIGLIGYMEMCENFNRQEWTHVWVESQQGSYAFRNDQWMCYEDARSLEVKADYVLQNNLGGVSVVYLEDDDFRGSCGGEKFVLLRSLNSYLHGDPNEIPFEYILRVSVFKKGLTDDTKCIYFKSDPLDVY